MIDLIYNKKFCLNKYQPSIRFNGIQLETFFAPAEKGRGAESFVKLFQVLADFNKKNPVPERHSLYPENESKKS